MNRPKQQNITTKRRPWDVALDSVELNQLRCAFRDLFDEADVEVQRNGFDQDEVENIRYVECTAGSQETIRMRVDILGDQQAFREQVMRQIEALNSMVRCSSEVHIIGIGVDVVRDCWKWYGG